MQSIPLTRDLGPFSAFAVPVEWLALALAAIISTSLLLFRAGFGRSVSVAGRVALFVTSVVVYLKLVMLFHPSKLLIDAVFHAHRLEWVLEGRYFFTQPMPSGVTFPYAIGLYVFTAPFTVFTSDLVSLLRIVVTIAEAVGGLLLFRLIKRGWGDEVLAVAATVLYSLVPRTFEIVGNANLTNAFGQSVALAALAAATLWPLDRGRWRSWTALTMLIAFALLCHISTFTLLGAILAALCLLYRFWGRPPLHSEAWALAGALVVATVLAIALYYGHFGEAFRSAATVRATQAVTTPSPSMSISLWTRTIDAGRMSVLAVGWPILLLAIPGIVAWFQRGWRDRLSLAITALAITFTLSTASVVVMPVDAKFYRYALEFITRVTLATYPAMVIWAALGAVTWWRRGGLARYASVILVAGAIAAAGDAWIGWIR